MSNIVKNISTLKRMEKAGLIIFHSQTGTKITGLYGGKSFTCCYIDDKAPGIPSTFRFRNRYYNIEYISGSFFPYVIEVPEPNWIKNWQKGFKTLKEFNDYIEGKSNKINHGTN